MRRENSCQMSQTAETLGQLVLLTCSPAHHWPCLLGPGFHSCYACRKLPAYGPTALSSPLHRPGLTVNQPGIKPAWKRGGWLRFKTCPAVQHPAEMLVAEWEPAAAWEQGYAAKASATCLETVPEAQRERSRLRKQTDALLDFPSLPETAEALPGTMGTDGLTTVVRRCVGCSGLSCCLPQHL